MEKNVKEKMVKLVGTLEEGKEILNATDKMVFAGNVMETNLKINTPFTDKKELNVRFNVLDEKEINYIKSKKIAGKNGKQYKYYFCCMYEKKDSKYAKVGNETCFIYNETDKVFIGSWLSAGSTIGLLRLITEEYTKAGFSKMDTFYKSITLRSDKEYKSMKNQKPVNVSFKL